MVAGFACVLLHALLLRVTAVHTQIALAHPLDKYPRARCLDGSPGLYYLRSGSGTGQIKFLIFAEGGGFCTSHADCLARSKTELGSTVNDSSEQELTHPFFTSSPELSPLLWNWNHVYVRYCDGAYLSGLHESAISVDSRRIYYRGQAIMEAVMQDLKLFGLDKATDVVFAGCSAGAIHTFTHLDALRSMVPQTARVVGFPDSGFYLDIPMFTEVKRFVIVGQNATGLLNSACLEDNAGKEERCLVSAVVGTYLKTPVFAWQSRYDLDQRSCEMTLQCAASTECIRQYGANLSAEIHRALLKKPTPAHGVFLDSCSRHCEYGSYSALPLDDEVSETPLQAFAKWYTGGGQVYGQNARFPCFSCCKSHERSISSSFEVVV